jgi:hypothetical protein
MRNYTLGNELYTKGVPFANTMDKNSELTFVPFGFARKLIHQHLCEAKINLEKNITTPDTGTISNLVGKIIGDDECIHDASDNFGCSQPLQSTEYLQKVKSAINVIEENYLLEDGVSVCEFDKLSMGIIDSVAKQAVFVPYITASYNNPIVNSLQLSKQKDNPYKRFDLLLEKYPMKNVTSHDKMVGKYVKLSAYIRPEQLATEESVQKLANALGDYYGESNFIQSVDYNVEHYTNTDFAIRLDFYVVNMDKSQ